MSKTSKRILAKSFLDNINKLSKYGSRRAYSKDGRMCVVLSREADHEDPYYDNKYTGRTGYGSRKFRVYGGEEYGLYTKSPSGKSYSEYTLGRIREALMA